MCLLKSLEEFPVESIYVRQAFWCIVACSSLFCWTDANWPQLVPYIYLAFDAMTWAIRHVPNFDINDSNMKSFPNHLAVRLLLSPVCPSQASMLLLPSTSLLLPLQSWPLLMFDDLLHPNFLPFVHYFYYFRDVLTTNIRSLKYFDWLAMRPKMPPKMLTIPGMSLYRWNLDPNNPLECCSLRVSTNYDPSSPATANAIRTGEREKETPFMDVKNEKIWINV